MPNKELETLATEIWDKHEEVLDYLMRHRPDWGANVLDYLRGDNQTKLANDYSKKHNLELKQENNSDGFLRFGFGAWEKLPGYCNTKIPWLNSRGLMCVELHIKKGALHATWVMGPNDNKKLRKTVASEFIPKADRLPEADRLKDYMHFDSSELLSSEDVREFAAIEGEAYDRIKENLYGFLNSTLETYDNTIRQALSGTTDHDDQASA